MHLLNSRQSLLVLACSLLLAACGSDDKKKSSDTNKGGETPVGEKPKADPIQLEISLLNLTHGQPQSPAGIVVHKMGYSAFASGQAASEAIERLAEGGAAQPLLDEAEKDTTNVVKTYIGPSPVAPGAARTFTLTLDADKVTTTKGLYLTGLTMLVNTNDAFTGVNAVKLGEMAVGDSKSWYGPVWDSGTEANSEAAGTIPGPADSSTAADKGFKAERDDINNVVVIHSGVISKDDGLSTSILTQAHRFDQPAIAVSVKRIK